VHLAFADIETGLIPKNLEAEEIFANDAKKIAECLLLIRSNRISV
jgi:hypothetical protein